MRQAAYFAERARGGVGMIITGGIIPNAEAGGSGSKLSTPAEAAQHRIVTEAVHAADPDVKICMQILHTGPLAYTPAAVAPSPVKSRIGPFVPNELDDEGIEKQLNDFANCAAMAKLAGYDGVEIIGSAGYLLSAFLVEKTNRRTDQWGGSFRKPHAFSGRGRAPGARRGRADDFMLIFRIAAMDMLEGGMAWDEVVTLAKAVEAAGANIMSTHFCWHEAQVPTIATMVPRAAFAQVTGRLRKASAHPDDHQQPHQHARCRPKPCWRAAMPILSRWRGRCWPIRNWCDKALEGREDEINTCIACNQACLDHTFGGKLTSCLVNPRACRETELIVAPTAARKRLAVVGAGPAGLAYATTAAERGHEVTLFDAAAEIGGQFNLAKRIPGKEEFYETLRYYGRMIEKLGITLRLEHPRRCGDAQRALTRSSSPPASRRAGPICRASITPRRSAMSMSSPARRRSASASRSWARAASVSMSPNSSPMKALRRRWTSMCSPANGASISPTTRAAA